MTYEYTIVNILYGDDPGRYTIRYSVTRLAADVGWGMRE